MGQTSFDPPVKRPSEPLFKLRAALPHRSREALGGGDLLEHEYSCPNDDHSVLRFARLGIGNCRWTHGLQRLNPFPDPLAEEPQGGVVDHDIG